MAVVKSTIKYLTGVEAVQRKFALRRSKCYDHFVGLTRVKGTTYIGGSVRSKNILGYGPVSTNVVFMRMAGGLAPQATTLQLSVREFFRIATQWAHAAMKDLSYVTSNTEKINACVADPSKTIGGVSPIGNTLYGFYFKYAYKYAEDQGQAPASHELPNPA